MVCMQPRLFTPSGSGLSVGISRSTSQPNDASATVVGCAIEGASLCRAVARFRAAAMTNLARLSQSLFLRALFGGAKGSALVNIFMIAPTGRLMTCRRRPDSILIIQRDAETPCGTRLKIGRRIQRSTTEQSDHRHGRLLSRALHLVSEQQARCHRTYCCYASANHGCRRET
jgi:hypothetical protein